MKTLGDLLGFEAFSFFCVARQHFSAADVKAEKVTAGNVKRPGDAIARCSWPIMLDD